jgi:transmembrane sensor
MKTKTPTPELNRQILDEASEWFVDFRVGDVDTAARERFDEWLRRSPEHIRAYWEIAKTYVELPGAPAPGKLDVAGLIAYAHSDANVIPLNPRAREIYAQRLGTSRGPLDEGGAGRPPRRFRRPLFAAASVAFALVIAGAVWWQAHRYPLYSTDIGERRSITLADGSTVDLNARSQLRVEFSKTERRVELLGGQALFQVTKDMQRPFIVHSGDATVRAVGTQFDVYRKTHGTTITVLEGRVAVYSSAHPEPPMDQPNAGSDQTDTGTNAAMQHALPRASTRDVHSGASMSEGSAASSAVSNPGLSDPSGSGAIFLSAGEQVTVTPDAAGTPMSQHADLTAATAWIQRKLIFEGSKLSDVVSEFNRYNRRPLVIEDPRLADFQISGVYSSTDPASLVLFMRDQGLNVTEGDNEIRIESSTELRHGH